MRWLVAIVLVVWPLTAAAQSAANLIADTVTIDGGNRLIASGNVQVVFDGTVISARSVTYDQTSDRIFIEGPIFIRDPSGTVLTAERADLDPRLENGMLQGARLVLDQQLQLAANQIDRVDGRYSQLTRTAVTSCRVCNTEAPLWEIRADRVIHDEVERQIYFDNATFHVRGVPILWIPRMRLPDPTLDRATGFLIPRITRSSQLGFGLRVPYFIRIGDSRDLTLTPFVAQQTNTLEARYRQAFINGTLQIDAAISNDTLLPDETRAYLFAEGSFELRDEFQLLFDVEAVTDDAYLLDYGYSSKDRLDSAISLLRVRDNDMFVANLTYFDTLRDDEVDATLPPIVANLAYSHRSTPAFFGGRLTLGASLDGFERTDDTPGDTGRDMSRAGVEAGWNRSWILSGGLVMTVEGSLVVDYFEISQDGAFESGLRTTPAASVTLRWPLSRQMPGGTVHILEPVVSLGWSNPNGATPPNEDGTLAEFDEGNIYALTRFPGEDARESGTHTSIGLTWTRLGASGTTSTLTFGRILQDQPQSGFSPTSGLSQQTSDWLIAANLSMPNGLRVNARALFDDTFEFDKTEVRMAWSNEVLDLAAAYHWLPRDPTRDRFEPASEWSFDGAYRVNDNWRISFDGRYDVASDGPRTAGLGVEWRNECVTVDLSVSRRYTSSDTVEPSTDYGFSVSLSGFSTGRSTPAPARSCYD